MNNPQWYERFNTNVDVSDSIGLTRQYKALLEYVAQESLSLDFDLCMEEQKAAVQIDYEERYLS